MEDSTSIPVFDLTSNAPWPDDWATDESEFHPRMLDSCLLRIPEAEVVDGGSLLCQCPECSSPLSVRLWLLTADCWNCKTSITLSDLELLQTKTSKAPQSNKGGRRIGAPQRGPKPSSAQRESDRLADPDSVPRRRRANSGRHAAVIPKKKKNWNPFDDVPALLVSLLLHLLILLILAMLNLRSANTDESITLSTDVGPADVEDIDAPFIDPIDEIAYDLPVPQSDRPQTERQRQSLILADQEAKTLRMDPEADVPELPDLFALKKAIGSDPDRRNLAVRDPRIRIEMIRREGGTTLTEAAVARGLKWMALHQNEDGSWSLDRFNHAPKCRGRCRGHGRTKSDTAATSLCLLPFLGAGQTHLFGRYKDVVSTGLRWLIETQEPNGDLRGHSHGTAGMYAHGQAAIVLSEAYALTQDESLRRPAELAIEFIVNAQHSGGGWRYSPKEPGDTSVVGWQLMALQSAKAAGLAVPEETMELAGHYLDTCQFDEGATYSYRPTDRQPTAVMTAEALLCRMYLGWHLSHPPLRSGIALLSRGSPPRRHQFNIYYWYYATQVMHHAGGRTWKKWNQQIRDILVETQVKYGHEAGSWPPEGPHGRSGGRLYVTSLAVCSLEVYYRHAPIFRRIELQ